MEKICHITSVHSRYDVRIFYKMCVSLAKNGYDITLLCNDSQVNEIKDGVKIISTGFIPKNRIERIMKSSKILFKKSLQVDADIYHLHDPELYSLALRLKKKGKKVVFDSHEDYLYNIQDKKWIPKGFHKLVKWLYSIKEKKTLKKIDAVVSVTPHIVERLKKINNNTVMITNYPISINTYARVPERIVCFAGGISEYYMHDKIIEALSDIENVKYCIAGTVTKEYLSYLKTIKGFEKVDFMGKISFNEVLKLYSRSAIGMVIGNYCQAVGNRLGTLGVTKLYEYMASGLPMVATDFELWKPIVEGDKIGICVNPRNVNEIKNAIEKLLNDEVLNDTYSKNGQKLAQEKYNWSSQEKILFNLYSSL